jgi:transcriptional regulator with XRE-family HTH domain
VRSWAEEWCADAGLPAMSTGALAERLGKDRWHVLEWLSGRRYPSGRSLRRLSAELGRPVDAILRACELARERRLAKEAALRAREDAE